jgi:hypothetical protein
MINPVSPIHPLYPLTSHQRRENSGRRIKNGKKKKSKDERKADFMTLVSLKEKEEDLPQKKSMK